MPQSENIDFSQEHLILTCPYCRHPCRWDFHGTCGRRAAEGRQERFFLLLQCTTCKQAVLGQYDGGSRRPSQYKIHPAYVPNVPESLEGEPERLYAEALQCYSVEAWNGCGAVFRRAVEQVLIDKGATGNTWPDRLRSLQEKYAVNPKIIDMGNRLRILGRDAAHPPDPAATTAFIPLTKEDADNARVFCELLIEAIYTLEAKLKIAEDRRPK